MLNYLKRLFQSSSNKQNEELNEKSQSLIENAVKLIVMQVVAIPKEEISNELNTPFCRGYIYGLTEQLLSVYGINSRKIGNEELTIILTIFIGIFGENEGSARCGKASKEAELSYYKTLSLLEAQPNFEVVNGDEIEEFAKGRILGGKNIPNFYNDGTTPVGLGKYLAQRN